MITEEKIFIIGFNKTGTRSLHNYFIKNSISSIHWEYGRLAKQIKYNVENNEPILSGYDKYMVYSDMEDHLNYNYAHVEYFKKMNEQYPLSKFILNIRNIDNWIKSRNHHIGGKYRDYFCYRYNMTTEKLNNKWRNDYTKHYNNVISYFKNTPMKLLIFNIENDNIKKMNEFLPKLRLNAKLYTHEGKTKK